MVAHTTEHVAHTHLSMVTHTHGHGSTHTSTLAHTPVILGLGRLKEKDWELDTSLSNAV